MEKTIKDIVVITGETNPKILLIAPHGVTGDDDNAGKLARAVQKKLGCHAIINEVFRKPKKDDKTGDYEKTDFDKEVANLNFKPDAEKHHNFISILKEKITDPGSTYVFWLHGIDDENLKMEAENLKKPGLKCLVGYGQPNIKNFTMPKERAQDLATLITKKGLLAEPTNGKSKKYRGADPDNMNQYFKQVGGDLSAVQSVQLEFAKEGVRDGKNIAKSASKIAMAISSLTGYETIAEMEPEEALVAEATEKVIEYIKSNHENSIAVGRYLIEKFYDNDFEKGKKGKSVKGASLNVMYERLEKTANAPSKSWFYNAINLAVDDEEYKDDVDYKKLNLSKKIYLTYLNKDEKYLTAKLGLIKEIATKGMSISELLKKIAEIKGKPLVQKIEPMDDEIPSSDAITSMTHEQVSEYKQTSEQKVKDINKQIADLNDKLKKYMEFIDKAEKRLSSSLDKAA